MTASGKRAGSRRAAPKPPTFQPAIFALAAGVTLAVVAWGYLVYAAIDFGSTARGGEDNAWWLLALASAGAIACLFTGLMLTARLVRRLTSAPGPAPTTASTDTPPTPGGRRAAR